MKNTNLMNQSPIYFVSGNQNKFEEMAALIPHIIRLDIDLPEIQDMDPQKIVQHKVRSALEFAQGPVIVDDTAFSLECLRDKETGMSLPGPYIKWFLKTIKNIGLVELAQKYGNTKATAETIIGYATSPDDIQVFKGSLSGDVVKPTGEIGFGWDHVFKPDGYQNTIAELGFDVKNEISPRAQAARQLKEFLAGSVSHQHSELSRHSQL